MKILILGSSGLFGATLYPILKDSEHFVITHSNTSNDYDEIADLTDQESTINLFNIVNPDIIINLVCLSDVDECERDLDKAFRLNVMTSQNISRAVIGSKKEIGIIHFSTDQVYDNEKRNYEESVSLLNNYAITKFQSEQEMIKANAMIMRTNFFGKSKHPSKISFSDWIVNSIDNEDVRFFADVFFSPLHMTTLSGILMAIIDNGQKCGIYNVGSRDGMSKFEFAKSLAKLLGKEIKESRRILVSDFELDAKRPKHMIMDSSKFENQFGIILPTLNKEIEKLRNE